MPCGVTMYIFRSLRPGGKTRPSADARRPLSFAWLFSFVTTLSPSQSYAQMFFPASIPLANRSPYLSAWYTSTNGSQPLTQSWPVFWDQPGILGWAGKIRVDNLTYAWMGGDTQAPFSGNISNVQVTPTRSIFTMQTGPMNVTVTFLSPIERSDLVLQSLPFSYVSIVASTLDGQAHDVQVYSDISAEWVSGNRASQVLWNQQSSRESMYHEIVLQFPETNVELVNQQAQDGTAYYAMENTPGLSWQIGQDSVVRGQFSVNASLLNTSSVAFAVIQPVFTVFGIAVDLGRIKSTQEPVTWAVGYVRDPSIAYTAPDGTVRRLRPYFVTKYDSNIGAAIDDFTVGYSDALKRAVAFDDAVVANTSTVSAHYTDLASISARQTLSTLDITVSTGSDGNINASDVRIFMKDIGSGATNGRVSPVERMYAAMPTFLYVNASLLGLMLAPLLDAQESLETTSYAAQDLGVAYPKATGTHGAHEQGIEQSGNMLIMLYAHARFTGDGSLIQNYYNLAKRWADYLVDNTFSPMNQLTADNEGAANMTNLAIKGIIGVQAMAEISNVLSEEADSKRYSNEATTLMQQWQSLALSFDQQHFLGVYGNQTSWALMYNLYADRLLGTNLVNQTTLQGQSALYKNLLSSTSAFGLELDSDTTKQTSIAWLLFTAATVSDNGVRDGLISGAWARASSNATPGPFPDQYNVETGDILGGSAGPAVGGVFSLLALGLPARDIIVSPAPAPSGSSPNSTTNSSHIGAIIGGAVGGIAAVVVVVLGVFWLLRKHRRNTHLRERSLPEMMRHWPLLLPYTYTPRGGAHLTTYGAGELQKSTLRPAQSTEEHEPASSSTARPAERAVPAGEHDAASSSSLGGGVTDIGNLRTEVDNLRQVIREIQEERLEPPPEYTA
ncbi:hypothetical protein VTO73DRAFT_2450 [Trametes versicolor]